MLYACIRKRTLAMFIYTYVFRTQNPLGRKTLLHLVAARDFRDIIFHSTVLRYLQKCDPKSERIIGSM